MTILQRHHRDEDYIFTTDHKFPPEKKREMKIKQFVLFMATHWHALKLLNEANID